MSNSEKYEVFEMRPVIVYCVSVLFSEEWLDVIFSLTFFLSTNSPMSFFLSFSCLMKSRRSTSLQRMLVHVCVCDGCMLSISTGKSIQSSRESYMFLIGFMSVLLEDMQ